MSARWFTNTNPALRRFWHPVAAVVELDGPGPHPVRLLGDDWVLAELGGEWSVLPATCPHRMAPLSAGQIVGDRLQCGYHGWCFDAEGSCVEIPALGVGAKVPPTAHLAVPFGVEERYGLIWVAVEEPVAPIPSVAEWDSPRFGHAPMPRQVWRATAAQMTDNFLDVAHFPFTHLDTIGNPDEIEVGNIEVSRDGWHFQAVYGHTARSIEQSAAAGAADADVVERVMTFTCWAPHHLRLFIDYGPDGDLLLLFFHQPIDDDNTGLFVLILAENIADGRMTAEDQIAFQVAVGSEDRAMLERLRVKAIPLDPGFETHTRADRTTVELRRLLSDVWALATDDEREGVMPASIAPPAANYAHARSTTGAAVWLHTSGVVPIAPDGTVPDGLIAQAEVIWANIAAMLEDAEMSGADVVSVTTYVTPGLDLAPVMAVRDQALGGALAASTLVVVQELAQPEWLMEIAIVAAR